MTAKNRNKGSSSSGEKSAAPSQEDASKKSQKITSTTATTTSSPSSNGVSGSGAQGPRSRSCLGLIVSTVFYLGLIGAAGFAAFYLQQVVEEIKRSEARHENSVQLSAGLVTKMESVVQQVGGE